MLQLCTIFSPNTLTNLQFIVLIVFLSIYIKFIIFWGGKPEIETSLCDISNLLGHNIRFVNVKAFSVHSQ